VTHKTCFAATPIVSWPRLNLIQCNERRLEYFVASVSSVFNLFNSKIHVYNLLIRKEKLVYIDSTYKQLKKREKQYCQRSNWGLLLLQVHRFVLCTCMCYRVYCSYKCIALYSELICAIHIVLLVVLCLKEVEFFLYAVTWFTHCELKGLPRLRWTLKQTNRTSDGESIKNIYSSSTMPKSLVK